MRSARILPMGVIDECCPVRGTIDPQDQQEIDRIRRQYIDGAVTIWCDNMSIIQLAKNPVFHARTKHIDVHYHFVREKVIDGEVDLLYVSTNQQVLIFLRRD